MSQNTVIGKVAITPQGEFLLGSAYSRLSVVSYEGSSYIAIQDNQNVPVTDTSNWYLLASKGNGIVSIILQSTSGNVDTYRITYDDNTYFDFDIHNGPDKTSDLENDGSDGTHPFITKEANDLINYELKTNVGTTLEMSINNSTYVITLVLKNSDGTALATKTVDLPLESDIVNGSYSGGILTLTKRNGNTIPLVLNDLVPNTRTIAGLDLADDITAQELIEALGVYTEAEVDALLVPINKRLSFLESNYNEGTATGSDIQLTDALNGYVKSLVCGNTTQVQATGKQIFDKSVATYKSNYLLDANGEESYNAGSGYTTSFVDVSPETQYTIQGVFNTSSAKSRIYYYTNAEVWISRSGLFTGDYTFTTPIDCSKIRFSYLMSNIDADTIMIEQGSTATSYEPYTGGQPSPSPSYPQPIVNTTGTQTIRTSNENLYDYEDVYGSTPSEITLGDDGWITSSYDNTSGSSQRYFNYYTNPLNVMPNTTYLVVCEIKNVTGTGLIDISCSATNSQFVGNNRFSFANLSDDSIKVIQQTTKANFAGIIRGLRTYFEFNAGESGSITYRISVIEDLTVTAQTFSYIPHKGSTITLPLGDVKLNAIGVGKDVIFKNVEGNDYYDQTLDAGEWYYLERYKEKLLDGTENYEINATGDTFYSFILKNYTSTIDRTNTTEIMSNSLSAYASNALNTLHIGSSGNIVLNFSKDFCEYTSTSLKAKLAEMYEDDEPISIVYPLNSPNKIKITDASLLAALAELEKMQTYKNNTIIMTTASVGNPAKLQVTYWVDEYVSLNDRVTALENRVALLE